MKKFTTTDKHLIDAVQWVTKNYDSRDEKAYVLFELDEEGGSSLSHENSTSYMKSPISMSNVDLGGEDEVSITVEGNYLKRLASAVKGGGNLRFSWEDDSSGVNVQTEKGVFTLPIIEVETPPKMMVTSLGEVDDNEYFGSLQRLAKLCITRDGGYLPTLETVDLNFDVEEKTLTMMATDRYALGEIQIPFEPEIENAEEYFDSHEHIFLPSASASLISPTRDNLTSVSIITGKRGDKFGYSFADGKIALFATKDVEAIKYGKLKEKATETATNSITVETEELKRALGIVSSLSWEENTIILKINEDEVVVSDNSESNTLQVPVESIETDEDYDVKFVRSVISEAFYPISTEKVKVGWKDEKSAFVFTPLLDDGTENEDVFVFCVPATNA